MSHTIYRENASGDPDANNMRAHLLKENFRHHLEATEIKGVHQRVLVKLGDWHFTKVSILFTSATWVSVSSARKELTRPMELWDDLRRLRFQQISQVVGRLPV